MSEQPRRRSGPLAIIGPGLLVAATGVGAGDLATGALAGSRLGVAVLWAVILGAIIKFVLNEGLARWQLATGATLLEGTARHLGRGAIVAFLAYLVLWSFTVSSALMSACGIAAHAILPLIDATTDKQIYGMIHSAVAVLLVFLGGYRLFEKVMSVCIGVMFLTVIASTIAVQPDWDAVVSGLVVPVVPRIDGEGIEWTVGLMGGIGGTVTVLCYGYWIREENRHGLAELRTCRLDLLTGYLATAVFGIGMVILGSRLEVQSGGGSASLVVRLADQLGAALGSPARVAFLIGAWGAVASSMLGVWQSVPYLFADSRRLLRRSSTSPERTEVSEASEEPSAVVGSGTDRGFHAETDAGSSSSIYWCSLIVLGTVPAVGLFADFDQIQLAYAVVGAAFMPILAAVLLFLNGSGRRIGVQARNSRLATVSLIAVVLFFLWAGAYRISNQFGRVSDKPSPASPSGPGR